MELLPEPKLGHKWGRWTLMKLSPQTWECSCGKLRVVSERGYYFRTGRLSVMCRKCREDFERARLTRMFAR